MNKDNQKYIYDNLTNIFAKEALDNLIFEINRHKLKGEKIFFVFDDEQIIISANSEAKEYQSPLEVNSEYLNKDRRVLDFASKLLNNETMGVVGLSKNSKKDLEFLSDLYNLNHLNGKIISSIYGEVETKIYYV